MERRHDPYSDERLLQMLEETSDISESEEETDQTYQQYHDDPESSDSECRLEKVIAPKKNKAVNLVRLGVSDMLIQTRPSTSECGNELIEVENCVNEITPEACTIETEDGQEHVNSEKSETVNRQKKFPVEREIIQQAGVKKKKQKKQKKLTKRNASKKPAATSGRKQGKKKDGKVEKPKQHWQKRLFTSKIFHGPLDPSLLQNPDPVRLPSEYFKDYISEDFYVRAANFTNMYAVKTTGRSVNTNAHELKIFLALHLLMGCFPFPRLRLYWQKGYSLPSVTEFMSRDRFLMLRNLFHLVDTENPESHGINRLWKIQPIIDVVKDVCMRLPRDFRTYSIDEQMIPFTGRCPFRQFVRNKPRPVGLKVFVATASSGLVLDFVVYQGKTTELVHSDLGLGPSVVMTLVRTIPPESFVFFDRYFTSIPLLEKLESIGLEGTGTIMGNRVSGVEADSEDDSQLGRGQCNQYVSSNEKVVLVEWQDSKKVLMASTCFASTPSEIVKRWSKKENQFIDVPCPPIVKNYNKCMGGVDVFSTSKLSATALFSGQGNGRGRPFFTL